jgi:hypothetical protein
LKSDRTVVGPAVFVAVTLVLTWATSALVAGTWSDDGAPTTRLLRASVLYAAVVGWQPLVALLLVRRVVDRTFVDHSRRTISRRFTWFSIAIPITLLGGAALVDVLVDLPRTRTATVQLVVDGADVLLAV